MNKIAVVTGGNGFVGSHLVDMLLEKGYHIRCIVRKSSDLKWLADKPIELHPIGLENKNALEKVLHGADYLYHVAGVVKSKNPEGYFKGNVEATETLLEAAITAANTLKRVLIVSSQTAAGPSLDGRAVTEEMECHPLTTYGRSKREQELTAQRYIDKLPITICRAPAVYGERDTEIFIYFNTFSKGITTSVGFDQKKVSLIHVSDLVRGLIMAAEAEKSKRNIYFISSSKFYTWKEIGAVTSGVLKKKALTIPVPHAIVFTIAAIAQFLSLFSSKAATLNIEKARDLTQSHWICDSDKAYRDFGFRQEISIEQGIEQTCAWYKKEGWI
ncbi:MAG: NAD(P)-dependent oxidoreductase [Ignavibacteriaceae bacterium]|nr:NAD(P)-dependent oxidoreductase [Ignavibacteriaceae bacterium]